MSDKPKLARAERLGEAARVGQQAIAEPPLQGHDARTGGACDDQDRHTGALCGHRDGTHSSGEIDLAPNFQRSGDIWQVVNGFQRLGTLHDIIVDKRLGVALVEVSEARTEWLKGGKDEVTAGLCVLMDDAEFVESVSMGPDYPTGGIQVRAGARVGAGRAS